MYQRFSDSERIFSVWRKALTFKTHLFFLFTSDFLCSSLYFPGWPEFIPRRQWPRWEHFRFWSHMKPPLIIAQKNQYGQIYSSTWLYRGTQICKSVPEQILQISLHCEILTLAGLQCVISGCPPDTFQPENVRSWFCSRNEGGNCNAFPNMRLIEPFSCKKLKAPRHIFKKCAVVSLRNCSKYLPIAYHINDMNDVLLWNV